MLRWGGERQREGLFRLRGEARRGQEEERLAVSEDVLELRRWEGRGQGNGYGFCGEDGEPCYCGRKSSAIVPRRHDGLSH